MSTGQRSGDRNVVGGDRAILDRGYGFKRRGDRWLPDRWITSSSGGQPFDPNTPSTIAGLRLWLKADGLSLSNNDPVATFTDFSGTSHDMTQGTAGNKPLFKTNIFGSLPAVLFDGVDDFMSGTDPAGSIPTTEFIVVQPTLSSASQKAYAAMMHSGGGGDGRFFYTARNTSNVWGLIKSPAVDVNGSALTAGSKYLLGSVIDNTGIGVVRLYQRGVLVADDTGVSIGSGIPFGLGKDMVNANREFAGYIAEAIVYNVILSTLNRQTLENYLIAKWGL